MTSAPQEQQASGLGAQLRALRLEHPTLAVLTEIVQLDERGVTFRATIRIDGEPRAQGHAAQGTDSAGNFVAAAERLAVVQALLLGGFSSPGHESPMPGESAASLNQVPSVAPATPTEESISTADSPASPAPRRRRRDLPAQTSISQPSVGDTEDQGSVPSPSPTDPGADKADRPALPSTPLSAAATPTDVAADTAPDETVAADVPAESAPAPRRKRDRRAERERARARQTVTMPEDRADTGAKQESRADPLASAAGPPAHEEAAPAADRTPPGDNPSSATSPAAPELLTTTTPRRSPARTTVAAREAVRADWRVGQPIPAWWPRDRKPVERPLSRSQVERLRTVALGEEITAAQLDSYSILLFGVGVAGLSQAQGAILEERLNPAYPSPLQELSARRVIYPLAVGDTMAIPDEQPHFIRWRDVPPPAEETPPPPAQTTPSWRAGGAKRGGNRRRR